MRKLDDPTLKNMVVPAAGAHIVLPAHFGSKEFGIINPKTSDGRVIFFIPWQGVLVAGTTGNQKNSFDPSSSKEMFA